MWATGAVALLFGFLACAGWLSWTAMDHDGSVRGPGLPAPTSFPFWQVFACGATTVLACFLAAHGSRKTFAGGLAAAAGTAVGFTPAFCVDTARTVTSQEGIGLFLSIVGWGVSLSILMAIRYIVLAGQRGAVFPRAGQMHELAASGPAASVGPGSKPMRLSALRQVASRRLMRRWASQSVQEAPPIRLSTCRLVKL